jgi:hypothetical protein
MSIDLLARQPSWQIKQRMNQRIAWNAVGPSHYTLAAFQCQTEMVKNWNDQRS